MNTNNKIFKKILYIVIFACFISAGFICTGNNNNNNNCEVVLADSNENDQAYTYFTSRTYSYLTRNSKGQYIRVQGDEYNETVTVYYYDKNFNYIKEKKLKKELPLFGAFYETETNYYILTGQNNVKQDNNKEVYRITKYDKNFKRISSCGITGGKTKTFNPLDPTARITHKGKYLYINTAQTEYADSHGFNHQCSICLRVDTTTMKMEHYEIGFVSHSFDEHILIDGDKVWTADINDGSSSIVLNYRTIGEAADTFKNRIPLMRADPTMTDMYSIYLGFSLGSFKASETSFLVAGTYDIDYKNNSGRDVFVASLNKETNTVNMNYLTSSVENVDYPTTPHMIELEQNKFLVLWSKDKYVYYTCVDGDGDTITKTYKMKGCLSDCVPIISGNYVTWYSYKDDAITFYQINAKKLSETKKITKTSKVNDATGLRVIKTTKNSVSLSWSKTSRAKGYIIYRYNNSTGKWDKIGKTSKLKYTDKSLKSKTTYKYKLKAYRIISGKTQTGKAAGITAKTK